MTLKYAKIIHDCRKASKMTQTDLQDKSGISRNSISRYENGAAPPIDVLEILLDACGYELKVIRK